MTHIRGSGSIVVWGDDTYGQISTAPSGTDFTVAARGGAYQSLAIRRDGSLALWGGGPKRPIVPSLPGPSLPRTIRDREFEDPSETYPSIADRPDGEVSGPAVTNESIDLAGRHSKPEQSGSSLAEAVVVDILRPGPSLHGQTISDPADPYPMGISHPMHSGQGVQLGGWGDVVAAAIGLSHIVVIRNDRSVDAWRTFLDGSTASPPNPIRAKAVAANAASNVVILMNDDLHTWGAIGAPPAGKFSRIAAKHDFAIALNLNGRLYGWGNDCFRSFGWTDDKAGHFWIDGPFVEIATGSFQSLPSGSTQAPRPHILALRSNGTVAGWGPNAFGETIAPSGVTFTAIAAGRSFSVGLDDKFHVHHWGDSVAGLPSTPVTSPGAPAPIFASISAGVKHVTAVRWMRSP